jgi:hydroxymethylbilane synthase
MGTIRVGTRGSNLALWQATFVRETLEKIHPGVRFEQVIIKTEGDLDQKSSLSQIGGQGIFTKEIEKALLNNTIDIAVHSLKDLPSKMPQGLILGAVPERGFVEDVLITEDGLTLDQIPRNAKVATGSIRRKSQLLNLRPDLIISDLRGNIDTRLRKLKEQDIDAIIMAKAAILRLELDQVRYYEFNTDEMIPAVGQGAIGIQIRKEDKVVQDIIQALNHQNTYYAVSAERALLATLDSGCQFPVGAFARVSGDNLDISGFVASEDGTNILLEKMRSEVQDAEYAGKTLAEKLLDRGAKSLLDTFSKINTE